MKGICSLALGLVFVCVTSLAGEPFTVEADGSVTVSLMTAGSHPEPAVLAFGFATNTAATSWSEGGAVHRQWLTNGIRYTQTALVRPLKLLPESSGAGGRSAAVLLVNVQGENTNSEYSEARAQLVLLLRGKRQELELKEGLIWSVGDGEQRLIGALEIPGPGVKVSRGQVLRFEGNMPPSEKGSMTVKVPLEQVNGAQADSLRDLDFKEEVAKALKVPKHAE